MKSKTILLIASVFFGIFIALVRALFQKNLESQNFILLLSAISLLTSIILFRVSYKKYKIDYSGSKNGYRTLNKIKFDKEAKNKSIYKFDYSIEFDDVAKYQKFLQTQFPKYILISSFLLYTIVSVLILFGVFEYNANIKYFSLSVAIIALYFLSKTTGKISNLDIYTGVTKLGKFEFSFDEVGFTRSNAFFNSFYNWEIIASFILTEEYLYLMFSRFEGIIIPIGNIPKNINEELVRVINDRFV
ncbi:hypothetical protein CH365_19460 [Leptospira neocaledonica]|uniref:YcxB-like protein domain-containing protein n=2 Tax=Leptospira neocaledonica TaxID=2023192 RepID=A0A2M9ZTS3_9LEPT|nr:hypothetical protein CH365_19460 [Leptospira neocaledonica]